MGRGREAVHDDDYALAWDHERALMREGLELRIGEVAWSRDDLHER